MSYKTILVHADQSPHAAKRIRIAAELALAEDAHLIGAAMSGISRFIYRESSMGTMGSMSTMGSMGSMGPVVAAHIDLLNQRASNALDEFDAIARQMGVASYERRLVDDAPEGGLALQARYCDLVVIGQTDPEERSPNMGSDLPEYVMLNGVRPLLIVPYAGQFKAIAKHVLIAWDGSLEATRAVTQAIPLLARASNVSVALFNPVPGSAEHGEQPGADIALYLARHGIKIDVIEQHTEIDIGNALLSLAADINTDLIVMGGYGHTRFREVMLGGVTRTVLKTMTAPVLIAH
jgi:nucleotide-binding universal stress UspA family protein